MICMLVCVQEKKGGGSLGAHEQKNQTQLLNIYECVHHNDTKAELQPPFEKTFKIFGLDLPKLLPIM